MDIVDMARASGLAVILDGRIGREEYQSVCGSISALQRFAEAVRQCAANQHDAAVLRSSTVDLPGQLRHGLIKAVERSGGRAAIDRRMTYIIRRQQA
ncbi:hypothetical protein [Paraburkholderia saeva]|jgi:hypothetical protein|uniref:hypothetical protein n=1 Tax=Paraburkholderia saeva TaxID=2777537 RepID=UPI001E5D9B20|nr:hypothetical protein [Paraburkholderia saeva]